MEKPQSDAVKCGLSDVVLVSNWWARSRCANHSDAVQNRIRLWSWRQGFGPLGAQSDAVFSRTASGF